MWPNPKDPYRWTDDEYARYERQQKRRRGFFEGLWDFIIDVIEEFFIT